MMTLKKFELTDDNHFVVMEYYALILNRTYLILLTQDYLIGLQGNGIVSVEGGKNILTKEITASLAVRGDLTNPYSYLKEKYIRAIEDQDFLAGNPLKPPNFRISRKDITGVEYDPKKKWGMGPYPHDGKVYVKTTTGRKREFIVLGNQSGKRIADRIMMR